MSKVEIYTWRFCPFCIRAKSLLEKKNITFIEHKIDGDDNARELMMDRANGKRTVPQIFIDNKSCLLYTSPSPRDTLLSRMPSSA